MTTYNTDFVRLSLVAGTVDFPCEMFGLSWPPPELLFISKQGEVREATSEDDRRFILKRVSMSALDDISAAHPNIVRGATYEYVEK